MSRTIFFALGILLFSGAAFGQAAPSDSQTLQALLAEVRQLRQDLRLSNLEAKRAQILIYRVQAQQAVVDRISERLEGAKAQLAQLERERVRFAAQMKRLEEMKDQIENPAERKQMEDAIGQEKMQSEDQAAEEQDLKAKEADLEEQFRAEQAKLGRLQDELDRLDTVLREDSSQKSGTKLP
jgi:hypothetical protein